MNESESYAIWRRHETLPHSTRIPDGNYWLNLQTGAWGYAGNPRMQGVLGDACAREQPPGSLSERRKLYRPGEILSQ